MIYSLVVYDNDLNVTDVISFSAVIAADESYKAQTTDNVVEYGFVISDHIIAQSPEVALEVVLSAYSIFSDSLLLEWDGTQFVTQNYLSGGSTEDDHLLMKQKLKDIIKKRQLFTLIVSKKDSYLADYTEKANDLLSSAIEKFPNCVITGLDFSERTNSASAVFAKLTIKQIRVAVTEQFNVDPSTVKWVQKKKVSASTVASTVGATKEGASATGVDANGNKIAGSDTAPTFKGGKEVAKKFSDNNALNKSIIVRDGTENLNSAIELRNAYTEAGIDPKNVDPLFRMVEEQLRLANKK